MFSRKSNYIAFWVASSGYISEAIKSAERFSAIMPNVQRVLVTDIDLPYSTSVFDVYVTYPKHIFPWYLRSTEMIAEFIKNTDAEQYLYFDTDTYMLSSIYDIFDIGKHFDVVGAHAPGRITGKTILNDIPGIFPEINIGVTLFSRNKRTLSMIDTWCNLYQSHADQYGDNDQGPLRDALWIHSKHETDPIRLYIMPPEYNCRFWFGGFARYEIKILHGRAKDMDAIGRAVNYTRDMRVWTREQLD